MERDSARLRGAPLPLLRRRGMPEAQCCLLRMLWGTTKHVCCPVAKQKMMKSSGPGWGCCLQPFLVCSATRWAGRGPLCPIPVVGAGTEAKPPLRPQHLSSWDPSLPAALAAWLPQPQMAWSMVCILAWKNIPPSFSMEHTKSGRPRFGRSAPIHWCVCVKRG